MYKDDDFDFIGVPIKPSERKWLRTGKPELVFHGERFMRKRGKFGLWREKHRISIIKLKWFGAK